MYFLQSKYWKEIKRKLGNKVYEIDDYFFQTTKLPFINKYVGYMPRVDLNKIDFKKVYDKAKEAKCINLVIDPINNIDETVKLNNIKDLNIITNNEVTIHLQNNLVVDLTKTEEELLKEMKPKHRYNLKLAEKKGVDVRIENSDKSFKTFLELYNKTIERQKYHGRDDKYLKIVWDTLKEFEKKDNSNLVYIATGYYNETPVISWMLFIDKDTIYYPYGGTSDEYKNVMAPYLLVWKIIKWGKERDLKYLDLFGIEEDTNEGYSRFKIGFGGIRIKYSDTLNLIISPLLFSIFSLAQELRKKILFKK